MKDKICLITGASDGIGKETAKQIAAMGATVVLHCRDAAKGKKAVDEIERLTGNRPDLMLCDLSSQSAIRGLASEFNSKYPKLDMLIHNAAGFYTEQKKSPEGIEMQFAVNHLSTFLLTHLLMPKLQAAKNARLIVTSSRGQFGAQVRLTDYNFDTVKYNGLRAYKKSKLCNVLFTYEFARRYTDSGITATTLHPGLVKTSIAQKDSRGVYRLLWAIIKQFGISIEKGAATTVYLATHADAAKFSGMYFEKCKAVASDPLSHDEALAKKLWDLSAQLTGIKEFGVL